MFLYAYILLTDFVAAFLYFLILYLVRKKPKETGASKGVSHLHGQHCHRKYYLKNFE